MIFKILHYLVTANGVIKSLKLLKSVVDKNDKNDDSENLAEMMKFWIIFLTFEISIYKLEMYLNRIPFFMMAHICLIFILLFPQLRLVNILYDEILSRILLLIKAQLQYYNIKSFLDLFCFLFLHCIAVLFPHIYSTNNTEKPLLTEIDSKIITGQLDYHCSFIT